MKPIQILYIVIAVFSVCIIYGVYARQAKRPGHEVVDRANARLVAAQNELQVVQSLPILPLLGDNWANTRFRMEGCGLDFTPQKAEGVELLKPFPGPALAWHAFVEGPQLGVLACLWQLNSAVPYFIDSIEMRAGRARALISVLGSTGS